MSRIIGPMATAARIDAAHRTRWAAVMLCWALPWVAPSILGQEPSGNPRPIVVCSTTQVADLARQVAGDLWEVRCVLAPGQDPHLYEIKSGDAELVAKARLCLDNGWGLEGKDWMRTLAVNAGKPVYSCIEGVTPLLVEAGAGEDPHPQRDPHAWLTPANAVIYVRNIEAALREADPAGSQQYAARSDLLIDQLQVLHHWIQQQVNAIPLDQRVLVTSHDAFNYFCREYGFRSAAPAGWSTRAEVGGGMTPQRRREAVESIRNFGVKAIFVETSVNQRAIRQIALDAGVSIGGNLYSDSMGARETAGESYLGMMRENVLTIVTALK